ncbi:unnamed protein product [Bursaphelenchus okinawaensis]|uniref:PNPLA domain-containing protein n=1 Tax=Bursaphelenchus okinawaensis TaxID=465554 RepID=A0A811KTG4_9BILA|nr:unnamed protein product [Bursaphelenchus okinawaensis]CAG9112522.1 unnamed protein product [Bursaphelenchus okinawaensis]
MTVLTRFSRFGIFSKGRGGAPETSAGALNTQKEKASEKEIKTLQKLTEESDSSTKNTVTIETTQPSYFGYLSGVVSSLWNPAQHKVERGEHEITAPPVKEKKTKIIVKKVSRTEVVERTQNLVKALLEAESPPEALPKTENLVKHLVEFPASRLVAVQRYPELVSFLLKQEKTSQEEALKGCTRRCLALLGYVKAPKGAGIRVLSIDGGGTRGMMGLEILAELEKNLGSKICEHFDLICGVSTGAIISVLLGAKRMHVKTAKEIYMDISRQLFNQGKISGVSGLLMSHSYYNTKKWVEILQTTLGNDQVLDTSQHEDAVKIAVISCIVNAAQLQPFVFRNYEHPAGRDSHFRGGTQHKLWQAIQASAAAPGYFEESL